MKYFSGFCLKNEKELFKEYLEENEFNVAGFSYGAQKAVDYVLNSTHRVNKLQLLSPAFFDYNEKLIQINLNGFKKEKKSYVKNFLEKALNINGKLKMENGKWKMENKINGEWRMENGDSSQVSSFKFRELDKFLSLDENCSEIDLEKMFRFNWEKIKDIDCKIEVFIGENDKIINVKKAVEFFKNFAEVYLIKNANHFLRSKIG